MPMFPRLKSLVRSVLGKERLDRELDEELRSILGMLTDKHLREGLVAEEARRAALLELGGLEQVKEKVRDARVGAWLDGFVRDLRLATRSLVRTPGPTAVVLLTLALGIGALSAIGSVARAVLLQPLPYPDPERLFFIWSDLDQAGYRRGPISGPELRDLREHSTRFESFGAIWATNAQLSGEGDPEQIEIGQVTSNLFAVLGVHPALGRDFLPEEEGKGAGKAVILSWPLWQRRYGGDPSVVGRPIHMSGESVTVAGVMPQGFRLWAARDANVPEDLQAWVPFPDTLAELPRALYFLRTVGRAAPGTPAEQAADEIAAIARKVVPEHSEYASSGRSFYAVPLHEDAVREVRPALLVLVGCVALVLLIAFANVASLLIGRALARRKETALLVAFGASRGDLLRHFLAQGCVLAFAGGALGLGLGGLALQGLLWLRPAGLMRLEAAGLDLPILALTSGVCLLAALGFSLAPLRELGRTDLRAALQQAGRASSGRMGMRTRGALVVSEVALGIVLLIGAGLLIRTFGRLQQVDPGFRVEGILSFRVSLPWPRYPTLAAVNAFSRQLDQRLAALPGVQGVGAISHVPLDHLPNWSTPYLAEGAGEEARGGHEADARVVSPGLFDAIGAQLVEGRSLQESDDERGQPVIVVDELLARRTWPGQSAVGKRLQVEFIKAGEFVPTWATVVGVVRHLRYRSLTEEVREQVYEPYRQSPRSPVAYLVRSRQEPGPLAASVRAQVAALDKELPVYDVRPLGDYVAEAMAPKRFLMLLSGLFAALALALASVGTYGVVSYSVGQRRHELAVRAALGARRRDLLRLVLGEGLGLTLLGLAIGVPAAALAAGHLEGLLFGVGPADPATYGVAGLLQLATALLACWGPARRATGSEPLEALRVG
jgi:putative ABC transport system permease protein